MHQVYCLYYSLSESNKSWVTLLFARLPARMNLFLLSINLLHNIKNCSDFKWSHDVIGVNPLVGYPLAGHCCPIATLSLALLQIFPRMHEIFKRLTDIMIYRQMIFFVLAANNDYVTIIIQRTSLNERKP